MGFREVGRRIGLTAVGLLVAQACGDGTTNVAPVPQSIVASGGNNQMGAVGSTLPTSLEVTVTGSDGQPFSGASIQFTVIAGTGTLNPSSATTGANGKASTALTLGTTPQVVSVRAQVGALTAEFTATAEAGPVTSIEKSGGDAQDGLVRQALPTALTVLVRDAYGNPVPGVDVDWSSTEGGTFAEQSSDASGTARAVWTLADLGGTQSAVAAVGGSSATFTARAFNCDVTPLTIGTAANGSLTTTGSSLIESPAATSCPFLGVGPFFAAEFYEVTSNAVVASAFDLTSAAFNPVLTMEGSDGVAFAFAPSPFVGTATLTRVIQGSGTYQLTVTSDVASATGAFTLTSAAVSVDNDVGCFPGQVFSANGVESNQNLTATDCDFFDDGTDPWYSDWFAVYLGTGDEVTIAMSSGTMDTYLSLIDPGFTAVIAEHDDVEPGVNTNSLLVHTATESGVHTVDASTFDVLTTGAYTMQITIVRSASAPIAVAELRTAPGPNPQLRRTTRVKR